MVADHRCAAPVIEFWCDDLSPIHFTTWAAAEANASVESYYTHSDILAFFSAFPVVNLITEKGHHVGKKSSLLSLDGHYNKSAKKKWLRPHYRSLFGIVQTFCNEIPEGYQLQCCMYTYIGNKSLPLVNLKINWKCSVLR